MQYFKDNQQMHERIFQKRHKISIQHLGARGPQMNCNCPRTHKCLISNRLYASS